MSADEYLPDRTTKIVPPRSSHSRMEPEPIPSFRRTSAGTGICPWAVTFECAIAIATYYLGNESRSGTAARGIHQRNDERCSALGSDSELAAATSIIYLI